MPDTMFRWMQGRSITPTAIDSFLQRFHVCNQSSQRLTDGIRKVAMLNVCFFFREMGWMIAYHNLARYSDDHRVARCGPHHHGICANAAVGADRDRA